MDEYNTINSEREQRDQQETSLLVDSAQRRRAEKTYTPKLLLTSFMICISSFLWGFDTSCLNVLLLNATSMNNSFYDYFHFSAHEQAATALLVSTLVGALIGAFVSHLFIEFFGHYRTLLATNLFFIAGALVSGGSQEITMLTIGRIIQGNAIGVTSVLCPLLLSEIAPKRIRGEIVSVHQFMITFGILIAQALALPVVVRSHNSLSWRLYLGLGGCIPALFQLIFLAFNYVESPMWLWLQRRPQEAVGVLRKLRGAKTSAAAEPDEVNRVNASLRREFDARTLVMDFTCDTNEEMDETTLREFQEAEAQAKRIDAQVGLPLPVRGRPLSTPTRAPDRLRTTAAGSPFSTGQRAGGRPCSIDTWTGSAILSPPESPFGSEVAPSPSASGTVKIAGGTPLYAAPKSLPSFPFSVSASPSCVLEPPSSSPSSSEFLMEVPHLTPTFRDSPNVFTEVNSLRRSGPSTPPPTSEESREASAQNRAQYQQQQLEPGAGTGAGTSSLPGSDSRSRSGSEQGRSSEKQTKLNSFSGKKQFTWELARYKSLWQELRNHALPLFLGIASMSLQAAGGINVVIYSSTSILVSLHVPAEQAALWSVYFSLVNVLSTVVAIYLIDRLGRKPLLYSGLVTMATAAFLLFGLSFVTLDSFAVANYVSIFFVIGYALSLGTALWPFLCEIFPAALRPRGIALSLVFNWIFNIIMIFLTTEVTGKTVLKFFVMFGGVAVIGLLFVRLVPETSKKDADQIQVLLYPQLALSVDYHKKHSDQSSHSQED
eukprot:TRINITY_DN1348_c0_g2_i1.p1 TRINITY_DN1348_c0_g2~~TRINITY_DN1348_c0_g2_i1.p1  ORF type:complete len:771 (+),score=143.08 TRINITY_DN1348_c0_g2_i1:47-2359(+)